MALPDLSAQSQKRTLDEQLAHLKSFELDLKFSAGVWYFSPGGGRFHDRYVEDTSMEQRLESAAPLAEHGLTALEAHYPNEINEDNLDLFRQFANDTGIRVITVIPNLFFEPQYEFGSLSSPIESARRDAIERTKVSLQLNIELQTDFAVVWPGIDGFENPFGLDFAAMWDRFEDGLAEAMDAVPGVRVAIEPKPYEPRGVNIYRNTADGILMAADVERRLRAEANRELLDQGHAMVTLNPEVGHILMGFEDLSYAFARIMRQGRLAHTHWNSQPLGNYDQDLNVGVLSPEQTEAALYVLKRYGYTGYFGLDINPERMSVQRALLNCIDALRAANDRINGLDHEAILACDSAPDKNRGYLEALLIRARAPEGACLTPMPDLG